MSDVVWLNLGKRIPTGPGVYWDTALIEHVLKDCTHHSKITPSIKRAIVIIPGAYSGKHIKKINKELNRLMECKVIITSDEENKFPIDELDHPNMEIYANYYTKKYKSKINWLPIGPSSMSQNPYTEKDLDWFFAGQVTHASRERLVKRLKKLPNGILIPTDGFAKGVSKEIYYRYIARAKAVPAPMGNVSPDSFRFYEALELGAIPIAEKPVFWRHLFPDNPMPVLKNWKDIQKEIEHISNDIGYRNECVAWWQRYKLDLKDRLVGNPHPITVIVPVSVIRSHPSTEIIDETIKSVTDRLPRARIIVTFDGVRSEQENRSLDYQQFISRFLWKYNNTDVYPIIFNTHTHQVGMARLALEKVKTNCLLYVEQDTPLVGEINWLNALSVIKMGYADMVRFHFEASIPPAHEHLMHGDFSYMGMRYIETSQYSQRPHLASRAFYRRILSHFSESAVTFIEDGIYGVVEESYNRDGRLGWLNYKVVIYAPDDTLQRSGHTDGRAGEKKYDKDLVF